MGLLGPDYKGLVDSWRANRERANLEIGREGSAFMDAELSKPSPHYREPKEPTFHDGSSRGGVIDWVLGYDKPRERDRSDERERE